MQIKENRLDPDQTASKKGAVLHCTVDQFYSEHQSLIRVK